MSNSPSTAPIALPTLAAGVTVAVLRRVWFATPAECRHKRATLLDSIVVVDVDGYAMAKPLVELTLAEVEARIGAVSPRFLVRFYEPRRGKQVATFVERADADAFAVDKKLFAAPAKVEPISGRAV